MADTFITAYVDGYKQASNNVQISQNSGQYTYGDVSEFKIELLQKAPNGSRYYEPNSAPTFTIGIGRPYLNPNRGQWRIGTGSVSGSLLEYNATTAQLKNAVSLLYGDVSVTTYGSITGYGYIITAATVNTNLNIVGESLSLNPDSSVDVINLTQHSSSATAQRIVRLRRKPYLSKTVNVNSAVVAPEFTVKNATSTFIDCEFAFDSTISGFTTGHKINFSISGTITYNWDLTIDSYTEFSKWDNYGSLARGHGPTFLVRSYDQRQKGFPANQQPEISFISSKNQYQRQQTATTFSYYDKTGLQTTSAGGLLISASTGYYNGYVDDVAFYTISSPVALFRGGADNILDITFTTLVTGTSVTVSVTTYSVLGGYYNIGTITFSNASLDEAFIENKNAILPVTLEIQMEEGNKKNTIGSVPTSIIRSIN